MDSLKSQGVINSKKYLVDRETGELLEVLSDQKMDGKERPWKEKKMDNILLSKIYDGISGLEDDYWSKKSERLRNCATFLTFGQNGKQLKLKKMNSCRVRLCPMCAWRRTLKIGSHARKVFGYLLSNNLNEYAFLMLTLTIPNVTSDKLNDAITNLMTAFNLLIKRKEVKFIVRGWYRGLEVTHNVNHNSKFYDTYHPHFHVLLVVDSSYMIYRNDMYGYISRDKWLEMWRECTKDYSITQVDIRQIRPKYGKVGDNIDDNSILGAVCEVTKYTVKSKDYVLPWDWELSTSAVETLDLALHHRRLIAWGGILKEIHKQLNLDDEIDGDLVNIDDDTTDDILNEINVFWHVGYQQYIIL